MVPTARPCPASASPSSFPTCRTCRSNCRTCRRRTCRCRCRCTTRARTPTDTPYRSIGGKLTRMTGEKAKCTCLHLPRESVNAICRSDHLRIHIPEFIHHDHHKKMITIHHHHAKPKEHHHHHHHHHKQVVHVPQHHHHVKKIHHTTTSNHHHGHHGHHGHHHGHHKHHHHGHHHGHHHDDFPAVSYDGPSGFVEEEYTPYSPPADSYAGGVPQVRGIQHTVKQVKVYDSLPGVIPQGNSHGGGGYQVTEEAEDDDSFSPVNGIQQAFPSTYGYLRGAAPQQSHDPFAELTPQSQGNPYAGSVAQPSVTFGGGDSYAGGQNDPFASSGPSQGDGFDDPANSFVGDVGGSALAADEGGKGDGTVSYHHQRAAGVQQVVQTGGSEVITY